MSTLTDAQLRAYEHDGVLFPIPVLDPREVEEARAAAERLELLLAAHIPATPAGQRPVKMNGEYHLHFAWAHALCRHPAVLDVIEQILGPDILVHSSTLFLKPPGPSYVSWHQDGHYWGLSAPRLVSAWIALADSTVDNGCLRVQVGSHLAKLPHDERRHAHNMLGTGSTVSEGLDEDRAVDVVLKAGEMSLHHVDMLHGSGPNQSHGPRIGYAIRYVAPDVRQARPHHGVVLVRGRDRHGHFEVVEPGRHALEQGIEPHVNFSTWLFGADLDDI